MSLKTIPGTNFNTIPVPNNDPADRQPHYNSNVDALLYEIWSQLKLKSFLPVGASQGLSLDELGNVALGSNLVNLELPSEITTYRGIMLNDTLEGNAALAFFSNNQRKSLVLQSANEGTDFALIWSNNDTGVSRTENVTDDYLLDIAGGSFKANVDANETFNFSVDNGITDIVKIYNGGIVLGANLNAPNPRIRFDMLDDPLHVTNGEIAYNDTAALTGRFGYFSVGAPFTNAEHDNDALGLAIQFHTGAGGANRSVIWRNGNVGIGFSVSNAGNFQVKYKLGVNGKIAATNFPEYADNAAAIAGGEVAGCIYKTTTGGKAALFAVI